MEKDIGNESIPKCKPHNNPYTFYCFDEKQFVCNECYKLHRKHKLEIKCDLEDKLRSFESIKKNDQTKILDLYASYRDSLEAIGNQIQMEITNTNDEINKLKKDTGSSLSLSKSLFDLTFEEYDSIENISQKYRNIWTFKKKIEQVLAKMSSTFNEYCNKTFYTDFKWIQKEVEIAEHSIFHVGFPPGIVLRQQNGDYYLSEGNRNHYITFDLKEEYYVQGFKIKLNDFQCTVKNFTVSIMEDGKAMIIKKYTCPEFKVSIEWHEFEIDQVAKVLRFDLIDNWGEGGGDYILITELQFKVGVNSLTFYN